MRSVKTLKLPSRYLNYDLPEKYSHFQSRVRQEAAFAASMVCAFENYRRWVSSSDKPLISFCKISRVSQKNLKNWINDVRGWPQSEYFAVLSLIAVERAIEQQKTTFVASERK